MGTAALHGSLLNEDPPDNSDCEILSQGESNRLWASLYKVRFDECGAIKGKVPLATQLHPGDGIGTYSCCFLIARENGRMLLDIHGYPAVFTSREEAERWLMPDERVEPYPSTASHRSPARRRDP